MNDQLAKVMQDFEAELLNGMRNGADEVQLTAARDRADDRLREIKESLRLAGQLESFFDVAFEIGIKLDMALKVISR